MVLLHCLLGFQKQKMTHNAAMQQVKYVLLSLGCTFLSDNTIEGITDTIKNHPEVDWHHFSCEKKGSWKKKIVSSILPEIRIHKAHGGARGIVLHLFGPLEFSLVCLFRFLLVSFDFYSFEILLISILFL